MTEPRPATPGAPTPGAPTPGAPTPGAPTPGALTPGALTPVAQDYLKVVWAAGEWSTAPVTTKMLAERLGVGAPTVSETVRRLCDQGLLTHVRYGSVELTAAGREHALAMVRRHRLIETFLVRELGYGWDEVHDEAEVLEHAVSDLLVERLDAHLGHPRRDPHGDPIPGPDGHLPPPTARPLGDVAPGRWLVARISDADPSRLRHFDAMGMVLDAAVEVVGPAGGSGVSAVVAGRRVDLDAADCAAVRVVPGDAAPG